MNQLTRTIKIEQLTLADWLLIAENIDYNKNWAFFRWLELVPSEEVEALTQKQMTEIAERIDHKLVWVQGQLTQYM